MTDFTEQDLGGSTFRRVNLAGSSFREAHLTDLDIRDVDLSGTRVRAAYLAGFREAFRTLDRLWAGTVDEARTLPPEALHEQVDEEWSFVETLRHLGFAHACWVGGIVLAHPSPWHPLDLPWDQAPEVDGVPWDRDVRPSLDEGLARGVSSATPFMTEAEGLTVAQCLKVVLNEEWEHRLYAERDLAALSSGTLAP